MTLEEFKQIWWMEYIHRMWGRLIGVSFIFPAMYFWKKNMLTPICKKRIVMLGLLIGCQGIMGWYMVKSGLENKFDGPSDIPRVSQYRLASHLGLAFIIYSTFIYSALDQLNPLRTFNQYYSKSNIISLDIKKLKRFKLLAFSSYGLIFLTAISGAFVAGLDAGLIYNTFPKMSDTWIPTDIFSMTPLLKNITENPTTTQFNHRVLGLLTLSVVTCIGVMSRKYKIPGRISNAATVVLLCTYLQVSLGILTLLNHIPIKLAAMHQANSLLLLTSSIWLCHEIKYIKHFLK